MKRVIAFASAVVLVLSACSHDQQKPPAPKYGPWGVTLSDMDRTIRPGQDFFAYSVGSYMKTAKIPADDVYAGVDQVVNEQIDNDLKLVVEEAAAKHGPDGDIAQKVGDFYTAFMNEAARESKGVDPVRPDLAAIDAISETSALGPAIAKLIRAGATTPFSVNFYLDPNRPDRYVPVLWQSGLSFSNRDYYLKSDEDFVTLREKLVAHVTRLLTLAGYADARQQADQILALETKIAEVQWPLEEEQDVQKTRTIMAREGVENLGVGAPLREIFDGLSLPPKVDFQVGMPEVTAKTAQLVKSEPLDAWKAYLRYQLLIYYGKYLSKAFDDEIFNFYSRELNGQETPRPIGKRGVDLVSGALGDAVGHLYVAKLFPAEKRQRVLELVENFRKAYAGRITAAAWMSPDTRKEAQTKLAAMLPKVGYPDTWKKYDTVTISADDLVKDVKSADAWWWSDSLAKLGKPVDRTQWTTDAQVNNAFYDSTMNDLSFPAGILQAPYYDENADPAVNYGEIGATIGHEMSHGFDNSGRQYDASGAIRDWWTAADAERYDREANKLVAQFDAYEPLPGLHINGQQTLGENIADLAGLQIAYDAYKLSLGGKEAPVLDGFTGDQRFFIAYAASWKWLYRDEAIRDALLSDVHSPPQYRVNGIVRNMDAWYDAFDVKQGDALYIDPKDRVRIW